MENALEIIARIFSISLVRYFIIAGAPFLLFYIFLNERLKKFKIQDRAARKKDFIREIIHSSQSTVVFTVIAFVIMFSPLRQYTLMYTNIDDHPVWWIGVSLALSLIIHDTYFYWMHRLLHNKKIYRHAHVVHHKSVNPSPFASYSFHLIEAVTEGLILVVIALVLPLHNITIILFTIVGFMINVYGHLGYEIAPKAFRKSFLFNILNTSVHHNLHHSKFIGNYGLYFRFWDRVMGTENPNYVAEYDRLQQKRWAPEQTEIKRKERSAA